MTARSSPTRRRARTLLGPLVAGLVLLSCVPGGASAAPGDAIAVDANADAPAGTYFAGVDRLALGDGTLTRLTGVNTIVKANGLAFADGDTLYVVGLDSVERLKLSSGALTTLDSGDAALGDLKGVAFSPKDDALYATDAGDDADPEPNGRVVQLDPTTGQVEHVVASGGKLVDPYGIAVAEDGTLYVSDAGAGAVLRIDPDTGKQGIVATGSPLVAPTSIDFLPDGKLVVADEHYAGQFRGALVTIDPETGEQTPLFLESLDGPIDNVTAAATEASGSVLVTERATGQVDRVDLHTEAVTPLGGGMVAPFGIAVEPGQPPVTTLDDGPPSTTNDPTPTFAFTPSRYGSSSSCTIDGGAAIPCIRTFTPAPLADGAHVFSVSSTLLDATGAAVTRSFTVDQDAPDTLIDSGPSGPTQDASPSFTFEAPGGAIGFTCSLDGSADSDCTSPFVVGTALADGPHSFTVKVTGDPTGVTRTFTVDTQAPDTSISSGIAEGAATSATQPLFTLASNEPSVTFACVLDGATVACTSSFSPSVPLDEGQHTLTVTAADAAGNADPTPLVRHFKVDTTPPVTTIVDGPSGLSNDPTPTFAFTSSEPGTSFRCGLDGSLLTSCASPLTVFPALADGDHSFRVQATDAAGNVETTVEQRDFTLDSSLPDTSIDSGPAGPTNEPYPSFSFSSPTAGTTFTCALDGDVPAACTSPFVASALLGEGDHSFTVTAFNGLGKPDPDPPVQHFTVDLTAPVTAFVLPLVLTSNPTPVFSFTTETGATTACALDGGPSAPCTSPFTTAPLDDGDHTLSVTATDAAGNVELQPASHTFAVDTTAPDTTITAGPDSVTGDLAPTFAFTASEAGTTFTCNFDDDDPAAGVPCDGHFTPSGPLDDGDHAFSVTATDAAGNVDPTPATLGFYVLAGYGVGTTTTTTTPPPTTTTPPVTTTTTSKPPPIVPRSVRLTLLRSVHGRTLHVQIRAPRDATGSVTLTVTSRRAKGRASVRHLTLHLRAGRVSHDVRLPAGTVRLTLAAHYRGDARYRPASVRGSWTAPKSKYPTAHTARLGRPGLR